MSNEVKLDDFKAFQGFREIEPEKVRIEDLNGTEYRLRIFQDCRDTHRFFFAPVDKETGVLLGLGEAFIDARSIPELRDAMDTAGIKPH
ncbi:MAG: hypothetical protein OXI22_06830 [Defluviicoccus sp.]|nr:hypothetical protein [Defluviicoccus sp.]